MKKWLIAQDSEDRNLHNRINREIKRKVAKRNNEMWEVKCDELNRCLRVYRRHGKLWETYEITKDIIVG